MRQDNVASDRKAVQQHVILKLRCGNGSVQQHMILKSRWGNGSGNVLTLTPVVQKGPFLQQCHLQMLHNKGCHAWTGLCLHKKGGGDVDLRPIANQDGH